MYAGLISKASCVEPIRGSYKPYRANEKLRCCILCTHGPFVQQQLWRVEISNQASCATTIAIAICCLEAVVLGIYGPLGREDITLDHGPRAVTKLLW